MFLMNLSLTKPATPEAAAKGIIDNALRSSPTACLWIGGEAFGGWFVTNLWYTATVRNSYHCNGLY